MTSLWIDHFGGKDIRNLNNNPEGFEFWQFYEKDTNERGDKGRVFISPHIAHTGKQSLGVEVKNGHMYVYMYPYSKRASQWHYMKEEIIGRNSWRKNQFDQVTAWLLAPGTIPEREDGGFNFNFSWFTRSLDEAEDQNQRTKESGNGKWYCEANIFPKCWNYCTFDIWHPHHQRNIKTREMGRIICPYDGNGLSMAYLMTGAYFDGRGKLSKFPSYFFLDSVAFNQSSSYDDVDNIYGVTVGVPKRKDTLFVSWSKRRSAKRPPEDFEIRWSEKRVQFRPQTIDQKWEEKSKPFRNQEVLSGQKSASDYNGIRWKGSADFKGAQKIYLYIKLKGCPSCRTIPVSLATRPAV